MEERASDRVYIVLFSELHSGTTISDRPADMSTRTDQVPAHQVGSGLISAPDSGSLLKGRSFRRDRLVPRSSSIVQRATGRSFPFRVA
jgi:hypothetical protein